MNDSSIDHVVRLPEQPDSSDDDESPRKRLKSSRPDSPVQVHQRNAEDWDHFVRAGARLKNLATLAMQWNEGPGTTQPEEDEEAIANPASTTLNQQYSHLAKLASEKTAECIVLEKKFHESESHAAALTATNTSLRESATAAQERTERTLEALRIAGKNAADARADADAAEAKASSLASQLDALRTVVQETQRATKTLQEEHEHVAAATKSVEAKLLQREAEFMQLYKERQILVDERQRSMRKNADLLQQNKKANLELERAREEIKNLTRQLDESQALEQARNHRSTMVEKELREARTLLVDASTTAADTESTLSNLNETIHILQDENKSLHDKMEQVQDRARVEQERLQEALDMAQKTAQELRLQATAHDQEIQRVFSEKAGCEKQIVQLKTRITNLEKRLKDTASFMSPPTAPKGNAAISSETESQRSRTNSSAAKSFRIPPLTPGNASDIAASTTKICCLCNRVASGLMKSCQCGQANCDKRAHSTCISARGSGSSLSHPGTPAPRLPLVLCSLTPAGKE